MHVIRDNYISYSAISFPPSFFDGKEISQTEIDKSKEYFRAIFGVEDFSKLDPDYEGFNQLIYTLCLANRHERCKKVLNRLICNFKTMFHEKYRSFINVIFIQTFISNENFLDHLIKNVPEVNDLIKDDQITFDVLIFKQIIDSIKKI